FDTLYAEGQRRYVETFSAYARQFLDRMDKPQVDSIEGVPPAIAIDQTNPVRTSRSTVGTMTELNDHLKLLFARAARLHCRSCGEPVRHDTAETVRESLRAACAAHGDPRVVIAFPVDVPASFDEDEVRGFLEAQGYARVHSRRGARLYVVQDRLRVLQADPARLAESIEAALRIGNGALSAFLTPETPRTDAGAPDAGDGMHETGLVTPSPEAAGRELELRFSRDFACAQCGIGYAAPTPSLFSFNSPIGACPHCRGFGRVIGVDYGLVIPDARKSLGEGAIKPFQTKSFRECQRDLERRAASAGVPLDRPWAELGERERRWVLDGDPDWTGDWNRQWYGVQRFFDWLESRAYKMHVRVLLSKYRAYTPCTECAGARLKPDALLWRIGSGEQARVALGDDARFMPRGVDWGPDRLAALDGLCLHDLMLLPIERVGAFFERLALPSPLDEASELLLTEIRARLGYLRDVGLGYLTLDRQSRTLSGGEVQRINLATALGTSLVNALFILDEPSIGLHPRDMDRIVDVLTRLRDAGNSLVVVEHDPQVMLAADRVIDIGPGPGERGGRVVFDGTPEQLRRADTLTGRYLGARLRVQADRRAKAPGPGTRWLRLRGASEHNLKRIDVELPLGRLTVVTGVSGSGKSTLISDVLAPALLKHFGRATEAAGAFEALEGAEQVGGVFVVDQSPIGRTTRSNPASYVGAFDAVRARFARTAEARARGYGPGMFSFNAGDGRCPGCGGTGFEHVEMQFLSDVYLRCPDCDGRRYRPEVLEVRLDGRSIAEVLDLSVSVALEVFRDDAEIVARLRPLAAVGLEYLRLGQPVPTLSGGEAQRLKLAGHLAEASARGARGVRGAGRAGGARGTTPAEPPRGSLFLFDEPTTGLHFDDIA
ncbi:MAG: excinuclease ABC subunit UvrA, partial [Burkholderiales bacterium]